MVVADMFVAHERSNFEELRRDGDSEKWKMEMHEEIQEVQNHKIWKLVDPSSMRIKFIDCRFVFKEKPATRATSERHKVRLVAKGFQQRRGVYCNETYEPVTRISSICLLLARKHTCGLSVYQVDVKKALLNGNLDEKIYMSETERFLDNCHPYFV